MTIEQRERLNKVTGKYKVTQPEVIQTLIDHMSEANIAPSLIKIRENKLRVRAEAINNELRAKFNKLTPEQIAMLEAM
jgi:hypothetical protein